jgi:hypothetical protein
MSASRGRLSRLSPQSTLQSRNRGISGDGGNRTHARFLPSSALDIVGNCGAERWFCGCYPPEPWGGGAC